jgi:hypothetical protein
MCPSDETTFEARQRMRQPAGGLLFCDAGAHLGLDRGGRSEDTPVVDRVGRWLGIFAVLCAVVGVHARAAQAATVSPRELRARQDFAAGRYEEAIEIFAELYAKTADPIFLRNIARCYQKQNRADEAIANFREYLTKAKKFSPGEKEEVEGYIRDLEARRTPTKPAEPATPPPAAARAPAVAEAAPAKTPPPASHPAATAGTPATASEPAAELLASGDVGTRAPVEAPPRTQVRAKAEPARQSGGSVSVPGVVLTAAGVAAIGGGVAFGLAARSAATAVASQYDPSRDSAGKRDATLQWVGYGVGAAALVTGVILLVRGPGEVEAAPSSSVQVGMYPGGASLSGHF